MTLRDPRSVCFCLVQIGQAKIALPEKYVWSVLEEYWPLWLFYTYSTFSLCVYIPGTHGLVAKIILAIFFFPRPEANRTDDRHTKIVPRYYLEICIVMVLFINLFIVNNFMMDYDTWKMRFVCIKFVHTFLINFNFYLAVGASCAQFSVGTIWWRNSSKKNKK